MKSLPQSFLDALTFGSDCWTWNRSVDSRGYGNLKHNGRQARAHRLAYEYAYGPIPRGEGHHGVCVMHMCDNKLCCNPAHLRLGTHSENMADMRAKGRRKTINTGAKNGRAKLTGEQAAAIRADKRGQRAIASDYGISPAQVQRIRLGLQWRAPKEG